VIAGAGIVVGVLHGFACERALGKYFGEVQMPGILPLLMSAGVILAAAVIASAVPAARAARVDTLEALRAE